MRNHVVDWLAQVMPYDIASLIAPTWFTMVGIAGLAVLLWMLRIGKREGIDRGVIAALVLWPYLAAVVGGIVLPLAIDCVQQIFTTGRVTIHWAGMTSFWGYLCGFAALAQVCRKHGLSLARFGDLAAAPLGLALMFSRLGCFLAGCDYGKVTSLPWALRFPAGSPAWQDHVASGLIPADRGASLPVHPTELYESLLGIVIVIAALVLARRVRRDGRIVLACAAIYSVGRIGIEALRGDAGRGIYLGLSSGQLFSLGVLAAIAVGWMVGRRRIVATVATVTAIALMLDVGIADAQPAPAPPPAATPPPTPPPAAAAPAPMPAQPRAMPAEEAPDPNALHIHAGLLFGVATPLNRRPDQVGLLAGPTVSVGFGFGNIGIWADFDSYGNRDASHGTILLSGGVMNEIRPGIVIGARMGVGATLVNFDDPAFRDITGTTLRIESVGEYAFGSAWTIWLRPFAFDLLTAKDLGGPIFTYQMRVGIAYRFGEAKKAPPAPAQPPQPYPPQPYPPQPYPPQPYPPQPYPPQPQQPAQGTERGACYPNNTCNTGLTCASNRCVVLPK